MNDRTIDQTRLAKMLGVSVREIRTLTENGIIKKAGPNKFDAIESVSRYIQHLESKKINDVLSRFKTEDRPGIIELFERQTIRRIGDELQKCKTSKQFENVLLNYFPSRIFENLGTAK